MRGQPYVAVRIEGGLLPEDLVTRVAMADRELPGSRAEDYHLAASERLGDAASRKWEYLRGAYQAFRDRLAELPQTDPATTETRERWLQVLLGELGWGRVPFTRSLKADGRTFPIGFCYQHHVPLHLVSWHRDLDRMYGTERAPQSLLQDFLNVSDDHLWGVLSNGRKLRILRDSKSLVGSAYIEFDLESIFDGELYAEFYLLFALLHASRFDLLGEVPTPADCWLERWRDLGEQTGSRAREQLRIGVEQALNILGTGFLAASPELRARLADGSLTLRDYHHELLRLVYQFIFLFVAEDRGALLDPDASEQARDRYHRYFSTERLRRLAARRAGDRHAELWQTMVLVLNALGADEGLPELGLYGLGGLFFTVDTGADGGPAPDLLRSCELPNDALLRAVRYLSEVREGGRGKGRWRPVDYRHLGAEELGSIYESLLELEPRHDPSVPTFWLEVLPGNERKTTGSYYTPDELIQELLKLTLDPVIEEYAAAGVPDKLLEIKVCDPACGSGHFLVAAARRIARRYAAMQYGDQEPTPEHVREALHLVVERCVYGVDINPLAAELAKVSLWVESLQPGKPLAFLDARIKVGNSLLGTTPRLLAEGLPDGAFKVIKGDDGKIVASLKKQNAAERDAGQDTLFGAEEIIRVGNADLAKTVGALARTRLSSLAEVRDQARGFRAYQRSPELLRRKRVADAWCAAFVWPKHAEAAPAITTSTLRMLDDGEIEPTEAVAAELAALTEQYRFFHWHLEFPEIFPTEHGREADFDEATRWYGGFTCVLGNPPWERVKIQEKEFFASRHGGITDARNAAERKRLIAALENSDSEPDRRLYADFRAELRLSDGISQLLRESRRYPKTGQGDINTYAVFAETGRTIIHAKGRAGLVLPTGIATDATTAAFFGDLVATESLAAVYDFENEEKLFKDVNNRPRFCLFALAGSKVAATSISLAFRARQVRDLSYKRFTLTSEDIERLNPNTLTCPVFDDPRHARIVADIYRNVPVLWSDEPSVNSWGISFLRMFDMANDSGLFATSEELEQSGWKLQGNIFVRGGERMLPLYEAKMIHHFDSRFSTYEGATQAQLNKGTLPRLGVSEHQDPTRLPMPRYWVFEEEVDARIARRAWSRDWQFGWRDIARSSDERTAIFGLVPRVAVNHKFPLANPPVAAPLLLGNVSAFVFDYVARQKFAGTSMAYFILRQLPVLVPDTYEEVPGWWGGQSSSWIFPRIMELTYTAYDMELFALEFGDEGEPFVWDEERRFVMRAELDAAYFHLYGVERDDVAYIMDSFRAFQNNDPERFARTKGLILEIYDAMAEAEESGKPYETRLDPPPGQGPRHPAMD